MGTHPIFESDFDCLTEMGGGGDAWLESLDEFKLLKKYEDAKQQKRNDMMKAERTVRGDWKPRSKGRGDWICPRHECGNINFGYRDECNLCGENRPKSNFFNIKGRFVRPSDTGGEIGEEASTKSGGLFNAEDWICRCGNINWAKRSACHECGRARIELAPRLGARMADSEGRAIKSELASRAKDKTDRPKEVPFDQIKDPVKYTRELMTAADCARVGRGKFAMTNPAEVYGDGSMAGMERVNPMIGDSSLKARYDEFMTRSRGNDDMGPKGISLPGFHRGYKKGGASSDDDEDLGQEAKREIEIEDEMDGTTEEDPNAEKKAEEMGILWYDQYSTAEEYAARSKRDRELEASNENYTGARLPDRVRRKSSSDEDEETNEQPKHPWDFNIDASRQKLAAEQNAEAEDENPVFNLLDEKERKRLLEKKLEKQMKKIQKQLEKEKLRVEEKKEVKDEPKSDDDEDVDGVPMEDGEDKVAEKAKFRHPAIPGGLLEPEQRNTVKLALKMQPKKMIQRNNVKKTFTVKKKR